MKLTERDKKCYEFLIKTRLPFTISSLAEIFYNPNGNSRSAYTISSRRVSTMCKLGYLSKENATFGGETIVYAVKPNKTQLRHKLTQSKFMEQLSKNGFEIINAEPEYSFKNYGIRSDMLITIRYNKKDYLLIVECNLNTPFNEKYDELVKDVVNQKLKLNLPIILINISDHKLEGSFEYAKPLTLKTDFSNFNKFIYLFVK